MKIYFTTFGGGGPQYSHAVDRIARQALETEWFDEIIPIKQNTLWDLDPNWTKRNKEFILSNSRGFGYWIWKRFLIKHVMNRMADGDILLYADSGCEINYQGTHRFNQYVDFVNENLALTFATTAQEHVWNKMDLLTVFGIDCRAKEAESDQIAATVFLIKKKPQTVALASLWSSLCEFRNYSLLDDTPSVLANSKDFIEHRHDQSIFSLLIKTFLPKTIIRDETYFIDLWQKGLFPHEFPFQSFRNKGHPQRLPLHPSPRKAQQ